MHALHNQQDRFTQRLRQRLKTTCMGLGLVRLLQDAGRTEEARLILATLESAQRVDDGVAEPIGQANRLTDASKRFSKLPRSAQRREPRTEIAHSSC